MLRISRSRSSIKSKYYMHGQAESVDSAKYLVIRSTVNITLGFVKLKTEEIIARAYNSLVRPQAEYASSVTKENIRRREN